MKNFALAAAVLTVASFNASAAPIEGTVIVSARFTPNIVSAGAMTTFSWTASSGAYCDVSGLPEGPVSGGATGSSTFVATGPVTAHVWCENGDAIGSRSATLTVSNAAPTVTASFAPATVYVNGASSTLTWKAPLATSCSSPQLGGVAAASGSISIPPTASPTQQNFTINCLNAFGTGSATATLTTKTAPIYPPTFTGYASPSFMFGAGWVSFYFYSTDTAGCNFSFMSYVTHSTSAPAQCSNAGGTTTAWAYVSVYQQYTYSKFQTMNSVVKDGKAISSSLSTAQPNLKQLGIDLSKKRYASVTADMNKDGTLDVMVFDAAKSQVYIVLNTAGQYTIAKTVDNISSLTQIKEVFVPKSNNPAEIRVTVASQQ